MKHVTISLARQPCDRSAAITFIAKAYFKRFATIPSESALYFIARTGSSVIGAIALDFENEKGYMPLETIYSINRTNIPLPLTAYNSAQFGRWSTESTDVSLPLLYAASLYALRDNRAYGWLNHTLAVHRILTRNGIVFTPIEAILVTENIRDEDRLFYTKNLDVRCYIMELEQVIRILQRIIFNMSNTTIIFTK